MLAVLRYESCALKSCAEAAAEVLCVHALTAAFSHSTPAYITANSRLLRVPLESKSARLNLQTAEQQAPAPAVAAAAAMYIELCYPDWKNTNITVGAELLFPGTWQQNTRVKKMSAVCSGLHQYRGS